MQELTGILSAATAGIGYEYFYLAIAGGDPVYRERVYCYELYHRMRCLWPVETGFRLNGEVDKSAHPILGAMGLAGLAKPDFLVHRPGDMGGNHAIIEVKHCQAGSKALRKDLEKMSTFIRDVGYQRAIYLIYGHGADERVLEKVHEAARRVQNLAPVELWFHAGDQAPAVHVGMVG
jgi:hypothetical protein